jgi:probable phosphoglycerate mutase
MKNSFYFIRHGETDWNKNHLYMGSKDIPLNQRGVDQAYQAIELLKNITISAIVSGPLARARQTAEIIGQSLGKQISFCDDLRECCWGIKEGTSINYEETLLSWNSGDFIEGAESFSSFCQRINDALDYVDALPSPTLIVAHGNVYVAIQHLLNLPYFDLPHATPFFHSWISLENKWVRERLKIGSV